MQETRPTRTDIPLVGLPQEWQVIAKSIPDHQSFEDFNQGETVTTHLLPEEVCQSKSATSMTAQAEQANKHDGEQDDVGDQRENKIELQCTVGRTAGI